MNQFFAMMSRMKYIDRWALMRNSRKENLSEHSLEAAMIAHALAVIGNVYFGKQLDENRAAVLGMYHDAAEILTGDMPTPVKYGNPRMKEIYKEIEKDAFQTLSAMLPEKMQQSYAGIFGREKEDAYLMKLVKAADKLSAYIKCMEEEHAGNREFVNAREMTLHHLRKMELEEVELFLNCFLDAYGRNLDELTGGER